MAMVKVSPTLKVQDFFSPDNEADLSDGDLDYGCSNVILLPKQSGTHPEQVLSAGKWGTIYLNDRDTGHLGEFHHDTNADLGEANIVSDPTSVNLHNSIGYWNGHVYIAGDNLVMQTYAVGKGRIGSSPTSTTAHVFGTGALNGQGAGPTISSNGTANGIVWAVDNSRYDNALGVLYAYDANNLSKLLYSSNQAAASRDTAATANKYQDAVVANGYVYVAGQGAVTIYGLLKAATGKPTVTTPAAASPSPVNGTTTKLSVAATDLAGDAAPTYSWAVKTAPTGVTAPTFSVNGTAASAKPTFTFEAAGAYTLVVTVTDPTSRAAVTSSELVSVNPTLSALTLSPTKATVAGSATRQFTATARDQFGHTMVPHPALTFAVKRGGAGGTISTSGLFTAPSTGTGTSNVVVTAGSIAAHARVTVTAEPTPSSAAVQADLSTAYNESGNVADDKPISAHDGASNYRDVLSGNLLGTRPT